MRRIVLSAGCLVLLVSVTPVGAQTAPKNDSLALGRKWTEWLYKNQIDSLVAAHAPAARTADVAESLRRNLEELQRRGGTEVAVVDERFIKRSGNTQYWRTSRFSNPNVGEPVMIRWVVNTDWQIIGLGINPASAAPPIDKPPR
jgi:hypothetical protein